MMYDASFALSSSIAVWPGDPEPEFRTISSVENGDVATTSVAHLCLHTGTHVDAPAHLFQNGKTINAISPEILIGNATVIPVPFNEGHITSDFLKSLPQPLPRRILFKTRNTQRWQMAGLHFTPDYVALEPEAAQFLVHSGVQLVGVDGFSVDTFDAAELPVHRTLLSAGVVIVELLNLQQVPEGNYFLVCAPLKIEHADGAPARVFLFPEASSPIPPGVSDK